MTEAYRNLLALAARIPSFPAVDSTARQQLDAAAAEHIHELLRDGGDPAEIVPFLNADMDALAAAPGGDPQAVQRVRDALLARFEIQARKNAKRRRILAAIPFALLGVILIGYLTLKFVNLVGIHDPVDTREGMVARAQVLQKAVYFDSWKIHEIPSGRARFLFYVYLWPVEPTSGEMKASGELIELIGTTSQEMSVQGCGIPPGVTAITGEVNEPAVAMFLNRVSAYLVSSKAEWNGKPMKTLEAAIASVQCPNYSKIVEERRQ